MDPRSPLLAACVVAGSLWSSAVADQSTTANPKTSAKHPAKQPQQQTVRQKQQIAREVNEELLRLKQAALQSPPQPKTPGRGPAHLQTLTAQLPLGGSDSCTTPEAFFGEGTFNFDNTSATTGAEGQTEAACLAYGVTGVTNDVWFLWTAPSSGTVTFQLCGGSTMDSKIAAYPGAGCPAAGTALACNDDSCGLQSSIAFAVIGGSTYTLQLGNYPGATGTAGTFSMTGLSSNQDSCSQPTGIAGNGTFAFDNTTATTGVEGQAEAPCSAYGTTGLTNDIWFSWTAPYGGTASFALCGGSGMDSKIAAYPGPGCPAVGTALACNDDFCGLQSSISFPVAGGSSYTLQLGNYPGAAGSSGTFTLNVQASAGPGDDCSNAIAISGTGTYVYDNTLATTSAVQGLACGTGTIYGDEWYDWTCPTTGVATLSMCGGLGFDTVIAAYAGSGCPVPGSALTCDDDSSCGLQSLTTFSCSAGSHYMLQIGGYLGGAGYTGVGTFDIGVVVPPPNDDCSTPTLVAGAGPFNFDTTLASTGTQGQSEALCNFYGLTGIDHDTWFQWTATSSGLAQASTCGQTPGLDTKIAAYAGVGCPSGGTALGCNDDACGSYESTANFQVTAGNTYTIQLGSFAGAPGGAGTFTIHVLPPPSPCQVFDDGTTENLGSFGGAGDIIWVTRCGAPGLTTTISSIDQMWGSLMWSAYAPPDGTPTNVLIYQDGPSQDGDPTDATLVLDIPSVVTNGSTDTYVHYPFTPMAITGYFFVGAEEAYNADQVVPMDQSFISFPPQNYVWGNDAGGVADLVTPSNNSVPPTSASLFFGFDSYFCTRVNCSFGPATYICDPGAGGTIPCPCANPPSGSGRGCDNSSATGGASIAAVGNNSLANPTLAFTTAGEKPTATSILLQGTTSSTTGIVLGQGVRCATGMLKRLYVKTASGGSITAPSGGDADIPTRSAALGVPISIGQLRTYMVYYRDPIVLGGCSALSTFDATNTAEVIWQP